MTAPMLMPDCPTEETLAAFVDDRLDAPTRRKVTEHVANCGECRELVMMATDFEMSEPTNVIRRPGPWIPVAATMAAAAVLAIFVLRPDFMFGPNMEDVVKASQSLDRRPTYGRLAGDFPHREPVNSLRGDKKRGRRGDALGDCERS